MTPKILEYIDGRIQITPEAFIIKEINDLILKYGDEAEPYLAYIHLLTWPESPYINLPEEEIQDTIIYDVTSTIGMFDVDDPLIEPAVKKLSSLWESKTKRYYDALGVVLDKISQHLRHTGIESKGRDSNLDSINRMVEKAGSTFKSYKMVEKEVDEELKTKMRGKSALGEY